MTLRLHATEPGRLPAVTGSRRFQSVEVFSGGRDVAALDAFTGHRPGEVSNRSASAARQVSAWMFSALA